jgi:hypothetical protein
MSWFMTFVVFTCLANIEFAIDAWFHTALLYRMRATHVNYLNRLQTAELIATAIFVIVIRLVYNRYLTGRKTASLELHQSS